HSIVFLLSLAAISFSAPIDYEAAAKRFYGKLIEKYESNAHGEMFDLLWAKAQSFFPGILNEDDQAFFKKAFIEYREREVSREDSKEFELDPDMETRLKEEIGKRSDLLSDDAKEFLRELLSSIEMPAARTFAKKFADFRKSYDDLPSDTKSSLETQFPGFGKLEELQALVNVGDRLLGHVIGMCENLQGYGECEKILEVIN
ncbi:hypothetical protein PMAYCL1PPCAC_28086, partial [Pristionchus mayeri]